MKRRATSRWTVARQRRITPGAKRAGEDVSLEHPHVRLSRKFAGESLGPQGIDFDRHDGPCPGRERPRQRAISGADLENRVVRAHAGGVDDPLGRGRARQEILPPAPPGGDAGPPRAGRPIMRWRHRVS
jgi:hypothetical protein